MSCIERVGHITELDATPNLRSWTNNILLISGMFSNAKERICLDSRFCEEHKWKFDMKRRHNIFSPPFYSSSYTSSSSSSSSVPSFCISSFSNSSRFPSTYLLSAFFLLYYCPLSNILSILLFLFFPSLLLLLYVPLPSCLCHIPSFTHLIPLFVLLKVLTCTLHAYGLNA